MKMLKKAIGVILILFVVYSILNVKIIDSYSIYSFSDNEDRMILCTGGSDNTVLAFVNFEDNHSYINITEISLSYNDGKDVLKNLSIQSGSITKDVSTDFKFHHVKLFDMNDYVDDYYSDVTVVIKYVDGKNVEHNEIYTIKLYKKSLSILDYINKDDDFFFERYIIKTIRIQ